MASLSWIRATGTGPTHPDFTSNGSAVRFGLLAGDYLSCGAGSIAGGIDNWQVTVSYIPEPVVAGLAEAFLTLRRPLRRV